MTHTHDAWLLIDDELLAHIHSPLTQTEEDEFERYELDLERAVRIHERQSSNNIEKGSRNTNMPEEIYSRMDETATGSNNKLDARTGNIDDEFNIHNDRQNEIPGTVISTRDEDRNTEGYRIRDNISTHHKHVVSNTQETNTKHTHEMHADTQHSTCIRTISKLDIPDKQIQCNVDHTSNTHNSRCRIDTHDGNIITTLKHSDCTCTSNCTGNKRKSSRHRDNKKKQKRETTENMVPSSTYTQDETDGPTNTRSGSDSDTSIIATIDNDTRDTDDGPNYTNKRCFPTQEKNGMRLQPYLKKDGISHTASEPWMANTLI